MKMASVNVGSEGGRLRCVCIDVFTPRGILLLPSNRVSIVDVPGNVRWVFESKPRMKGMDLGLQIEFSEVHSKKYWMSTVLAVFVDWV